MPRPAEYENMIKTRALYALQPAPGAVAGFLRNAECFLALPKSLLAGKPLATEPMQVFANANEDYLQVVPAVLEFHAVRTKEAGRAMAIQRASDGLKLSNPKMSAIIRAHDRPNDTSYGSPFPPLSKADAAMMVAVLEKSLPVARALTGLVA